MTWQERLFEIEPTLSSPFGELAPYIKGERVSMEDGDVFEVKSYLIVVEAAAGKGKKISDIGDRIGDPTNRREAVTIKAFTELTRRVPAAEFEDMRNAELIVKYRDRREEDERQVEQRPRAV